MPLEVAFLAELRHTYVASVISFVAVRAHMYFEVVTSWEALATFGEVADIWTRLSIVLQQKSATNTYIRRLNDPVAQKKQTLE